MNFQKALESFFFYSVRLKQNAIYTGNIDRIRNESRLLRRRSETVDANLDDWGILERDIQTIENQTRLVDTVTQMRLNEVNPDSLKFRE